LGLTFSAAVLSVSPNHPAASWPTAQDAGQVEYARQVATEVNKRVGKQLIRQSELLDCLKEAMKSPQPEVMATMTISEVAAGCVQILAKK